MAGTDPSLHIQRIIVKLLQDSSSGEIPAYPTLATVKDIPPWSLRLTTDFKLEPYFINKRWWPDAALQYFLQSTIDSRIYLAMQRKRAQRSARTASIWKWEEFLGVLEGVMTELAPATPTDDSHISASSAAKAVAGTALAAAGALTLAPVAAVAALNLVGFSVAGVVGGSLAAGIQSVLYGGFTTGVFSACQSIAATAAAPTLATVLSATGALAGGAGLIADGARDEGDSDEESHDSNHSQDGSGALEVEDPADEGLSPQITHQQAQASFVQPAVVHEASTSIKAPPVLPFQPALQRMFEDDETGTADVAIGPLDWSPNITHHVRHLVRLVSSENDAPQVVQTRRGEFPQSTWFVWARFASNLDAIRFVNNWHANTPTEYANVSVRHALIPRRTRKL